MYPGGGAFLLVLHKICPDIVGVFAWFCSHCNTNPHPCPEVGGGGLGVHFDWCISHKD